MSEGIRKLVIEILSDASGVEKGFKKAENANEALAKKIGKVALAVTGVAIGLEHLAGPIEQARKQLEAAFDAQGFDFEEFRGQIDKTDKRMENYAHGFADTEAALTTLTLALGDPIKALDDMQLVADIAGKKHISLAAAADIVAKAHAGSAKVFKQFGIIVKENEDGTKDYEGALDELAKKLSGQASASVDTFGGKLEVAKTKLKDWVAVHSQGIIPALTFLGPALATTATVVELAGTSFGKAAIAAGPWLIAIAAIGAAAYIIYRNWDTIAAFFSDLWDKVSDAFNNKWIAIAALVIAPMIAIPILIAKNWQDLVDFFQSAWGIITGVFENKWGRIAMAVIAPIIGIPVLIATHWQEVVDFFTSAWDIITGIFENKWGRIAMAVIAPIIGIPVLIAKNWDGLVEFFHSVWRGIENVFATGASIVFDVWDGVWKAIATVVGGYIDGIKAVIGGMWTGIKFMINPIIDALNAVITVYDKFAKTFNDSPLPGPTFPIFDPIAHLAAGGIVTKPTLAVIGEAGPEAVIPLGSGMGGGPMYVTINMPVGSDGDDVVRAIRQFEKRNGPGWRAA